MSKPIALLIVSSFLSVVGQNLSVHFSRKNCLEYCETEAYNSGRVEGHVGEGHVLMTLGITKSAFTICTFKIVLYFGRIAGFLHFRHIGAGEVLCCGIIKDFYDLKLISLCSAAVLSWISMISEGISCPLLLYCQGFL